MELVYVRSQEEIHEGQTGLCLSWTILTSNARDIILPKSLRYLEIENLLSSTIQSLKQKRIVWFNDVITIRVVFPPGLFRFKGYKTKYAIALPHISQAMLAIHKTFTVNGYGKDVATIIMRAIYETGAIYADEWNEI